MTARNGVKIGLVRQLAAVFVGAALLGSCGSAFAQTAATPSKPAKARPVANPAIAAKPATAGSGTSQSDPWSVNADLGSRYNNAAAAYQEQMPKPSTAVGRVPLQSGSGTFGLTTTQTRPGQFSDGRSVPGLESAIRKDSDGYAGLSVSVPSLTKNMPLPPPPLPPFTRYE